MRKRLFWLGIYAAALAVCILIIYAVPSLAGLLERTYVVEQGEIDLSYDVDAYIVRDETVYLSDRRGVVNRLIDDGKLVKAGSMVAQITGAGKKERSDSTKELVKSLGDAAVIAKSGISTNAGYISYTVDGAENKLNSDTLDKLTEEKAKKYADVKVRDTADGKCAKKEPVFRTTKNGEWWLVFWVAPSEAKQYTEGSQVTIAIGDETANATVKSIKKLKGENNTRVILKCNVVLGDYLNIRDTALTVTTESAEGLIIQDESIVTKNKQKGVIVKDRLGNNIFKPIYIKADDGEQSAICEDIYMDEKGNFVETVKVYDEIVKSPSKKEVKESE